MGKKGREILWEKVDKLVNDIKEGRPVLEILRGKYTEAQIREAEKKLTIKEMIKNNK